jgi:hypothetical protein
MLPSEYLRHFHGGYAMYTINIWNHNRKNSNQSIGSKFDDTRHIPSYVPPSLNSITAITQFHEDVPYIQLKDIPENEVSDFRQWVKNKIMPIIPGIEPGEAVYSWDYEEWQEYRFWYLLSAMDA